MVGGNPRRAAVDQAGLIAISLMLAGLVAVRREHPAATFTFAMTIGAVQVALGICPGAFHLVGADAAIIVLLYTLAAYRPRRISLRGLFVCLAGIAVAVIRWPPAPVNPHAMLFGALVVGVPAISAWVLGDSMAYRRAYNAWLEQRARRAEAERDAKAQLAAAAERSRIAREMHDIIAHNLSVIVGLADGGRYAAAGSPERSGQALGVIAGTSREALSELRRLLGVLNENGHQAADLAPQPGLTDLEALLSRVRAAGLPVRCTVNGDTRGLSQGRQLTVYRIVQEALTNTLKHAGPAVTAEVTLECTGGAVAVQVRLAVLTGREREVLAAIARGWTNGEIADRLHLAESTVKTHVGRVLAKIGARGRVRAVIFAYDARLVRPS